MSAQGGREYPKFLAEFYDFLSVYSGRRDLDFYLDYSRAADGPILELGCGTGRILIPTAAAGCEIVGLDISEEMLARCREKLGQQPQEVQDRAWLVHGDMTNFDLGETFRLITTPFRSFQHLLTLEEQMACLHCAHRHLAPGGKLILDLFQVIPAAMNDPAWMRETEDCPETLLPDGRKLRRTFRIVAFHRAEQCNEVEMNFYVTHPDGRTERLTDVFPFRYFFRYEVEHLLARCGFRVVELFGNYDRSALTDNSPEMIFIAEAADTQRLRSLEITRAAEAEEPL